MGLLGLEVKWVLMDPKCSRDGEGTGESPGQVVRVPRAVQQPSHSPEPLTMARVLTIPQTPFPERRGVAWLPISLHRLQS